MPPTNNLSKKFLGHDSPSNLCPYSHNPRWQKARNNLDKRSILIHRKSNLPLSFDRFWHSVCDPYFETHFVEKPNLKLACSKFRTKDVSDQRYFGILRKATCNYKFTMTRDVQIPDRKNHGFLVQSLLTASRGWKFHYV